MVLKDAFIVVTDRFCMSHCNQERIVHPWVRDICHQASEQACHDVEVTEVLHQLTLFGEVMEVARQLYDLIYVVVGILIVGLGLDVVQKAQEVLVSN